MEKQTNMEGKYADPGMAGQNGTVADGTGIRRYDGPSAGRGRERLEKLPKEKHQEVLCAYLLLRMALWEQRGWRDLPRIEVDELGKPFFPDYPDTHFSLSHTAGAAAAALADTPVGVDIERVRPVSVRAMERIAGVRTEAAFFRSWVRREARVKRTGSGIVTMMRTEAPLNRGEFYYEVDAFHGYAAGVAAGQPEPPQPVHRLMLDQLL